MLTWGEVKDDVEDNVKSVDVDIDVREQFTSKHEFPVRKDMLQRICTKAVKLEFDIV